MLKKINNSFVRFLLVGIINTLVGLSATYISMHLFFSGYWMATFCGNSLGACVSFILNRTFTFRSTGKIRESSWRFVGVILLCYFCSYWFALRITSHLLAIFTTQSTIIENIAVLVGTVVYTVTNYFGQKYLVFLKAKSKY